MTAGIQVPRWQDHVTIHTGRRVLRAGSRKHGFYKTVLVSVQLPLHTGVAATVKGRSRDERGALENDPGGRRGPGIGVIAMKTQAGDTSRPRGIQPAPGGARLGPRQPRRGHDDPEHDELRPGRGEPGGARKAVRARRPDRPSVGTRSRSGIVIAACAARAAAYARAASRSRTCCGR